jgi:hypothetical protein
MKNYSDRISRDQTSILDLESRLETLESKYDRFNDEIGLNLKEIKSRLEDLKSTINAETRTYRPRETKHFIPPVDLCMIARSSSKLVLSNNKRTVTKPVSLGFLGSWESSGSSDSIAVAVGTACYNFSFCTVRNCRNLTVGFVADIDINPEDQVGLDNDTGYYLSLRDGCLYGIGHDGAKMYSVYDHRPGTVITCEWQPTEHTVRFYINGIDQGAAFENVLERSLLPAFEVVDEDCCFELCKNPGTLRYTGCTIKRAGPKLALSADKRVVTRTAPSGDWEAAVGTSSDKFSFQVVRNGYNIIVGFTTVPIVDLERHDIPDSTGYYLDLGQGQLRGIDPDDNKPYVPDISVPGTIVTCERRPRERSIRFYVNGKDRDVAFRNVPDFTLLPVFYVRDAGCTFKLYENP